LDLEEFQEFTQPEDQDSESWTFRSQTTMPHLEDPERRAILLGKLWVKQHARRPR
jgi:hypothetical protein